MSYTVSLPNCEIRICFAIWIIGVATSLYNLHFVGNDITNNKNEIYDDFVDGWSILGRLKDVSDFEWSCWTNLTVQLFPWMLVNFVGSEYLRYKKLNHILPAWYSSVTLSYMLFHFNFAVTAAFIAQALIFYIFGSNFLTRQPIVIWILGYCIRHFYRPENWFHLTPVDEYLIIVASSWMLLRSLSYTLDIKSSDTTDKSCLSMLGYTMYLPFMFCGPFISFSHFKVGLHTCYVPWTQKRICTIVKSFTQCLFWFYWTEFALHYIHVNAILLRPYIVATLGDWELAGLGIAMGHFFHLKYIVFYGLPCAWAAAEGFPTPHQPCCVSRVYLYSFMWRRFDNGLYQFLKSYIYTPLQSWTRWDGITGKVTASFACFLFVFVWHGEEEYVLYWVVFNFLAVTLEGGVKTLCSSDPVRSLLDENVTAENQRRLHCLAAAPLHYFCMVSNYFFIGTGMEVGLIYLNKFLFGAFSNTLVIIFFLYGAAQSALTIELWEKRRLQQHTKSR